MNRKNFINILCIACLLFFSGCSETEISQLLAKNGFPQSQPYGNPPPAGRAIAFTVEPIQVVENRLRPALSIFPDAMVDKTPIPGIYAIRQPNGVAGCPNYTVADGFVILEHRVPKDEWVYTNGGKVVSAEDELRIRRHIYANLPQSATIAMSPVGGTVATVPMVLYSAIDCGPSAKMEETLKKERVGYRIIPFSLRPENEPLVRYAVCSQDPMSAWNAIRAKKVSLADAMKKTGQCPASDYKRDIADIQCMTDVYQFPTAMFSDGTIPPYSELGAIIERHLHKP